MNKERRREIGEVIKAIINAKDTLNQTTKDLQTILDDEEFAFDNMPENLQGSLRGMDSEDAIDTMTDVIESLTEIIDNLDDIC